jgi:predicted TIM-barrel fold metal-dependent hydrolase
MGRASRVAAVTAIDAAAISALPKISADAHVDEPHDLWYERMDRALRDLAPRRIETDEAGGWSLVVDGDPIGWSGLTFDEAAENEAARAAAVAPEVRLAMMRTDGINGEIIYPTIGLYAWNITDPRVGEATCRIYNDWILERLGGHARMKVAAMVPTWDVAMAVAEIDRVASHGSVGGLLLPLVGTPEWNLPQWEPLWTVIAESGVPAVMHQGTGHDMIFYRGWGSATANLLATQSMAARATALLSCSGVLERHPALHAVLVEVNAGWIAWTMHTLDEYYQAHQGWAKPKLAALPSHYIRRQIHATFQSDIVAMRNVDFTGADCLLWGNDYPHPESTYPNSREVLSTVLDGVDDVTARAVVGGTAARLFGFADEVCATLP